MTAPTFTHTPGVDFAELREDLAALDGDEDAHN